MNNERNKPESINEREERILKFWQDNKIFEKSLEAPGGGSPKGQFVFYDGPPFATGLPHYGHILPGTIKDIIPRYKTMKGYRVDRRWGWDCHGLPIENLIEAELSLKTKKDIEDLGVGKFNAAAKNSVLRYASDWKRIIPRVGRWVDMENGYKTMDATYTESIWWIFKTLFDKDLIYEGYKSMHLCPRCETTLSNFEVNQGYKDITDISVTVKFELEPNTYVLVWTTTPWTLPGNVALAINPTVVYCKLKIKNEKLKISEYFILAKERLSVIKDEYEIVDEFKGDKLVGLSYKPVFDYYAKLCEAKPRTVEGGLKNCERGWKIYGADFVTTTDGTGVVHIAPAFGEDDMNLGVKEKLPFVQHVGTNGKMKEEVTDFAGLAVKPKDPSNSSGQEHQSTDVEIIKNLAHRGLLFAKEKIVHSYPHCWRCDTPLLNYAASSWFVKVTEIKSRLVANNHKTNWVPANLRDGRFGNWLEGARDWAISRSRYWGAPLPVWRCGSCKKVEVVGSLDQLKKRLDRGNKFFIMRHGESESVVGGYIDSSPDSKNNLTDNGRVEVIKSAEALKKLGEVDYIFCSDFLRTRQTAEIVADKLDYDESKIVFDKRLREINAGSFSGRPVEEYRDFFQSLEERFYKRPDGGEDATEIKNRVMEFLFEVDSRYEGKTILIISHADPLWCLAAGSVGATAKETVDIREEVYLSPAEFRKLPFASFPRNENYELDLHKPYIDEIVFSCCGGEMKRVSEVFDCWFESGSMPYASVHYPFENKDKFEANFPADFIAEGLDQTRGWFYSLMVLSTALFDEPAFENVVVNGLILAEDGQKMSKRLKNYPDLMYVVEKYGADALRFYIVSSQAVRAEDLRFSEKGVDEVYKKLILRLQNVLSFYELYAGEIKEGSTFRKVEPSLTTSKNILDKWILARLSSLAEEVEKHLKDYELDRAARPIMDFVDDLSTWYLRRSRDRFKSDDASDRNAAVQTTGYVLMELAKIMAPFTPFIAEDIYQKVVASGQISAKLEAEHLVSVHLQAWPFFGESPDDETDSKERIFEEMRFTRQIVSLALDERKRLGIPVRQPLAKLKMKNEKLKIKTELLELIKDEVNVKEISFDESITGEVWLDTNLTPELKEEGNLRELTRALQDMRKKMGLKPEDKIVLNFSGDALAKKFMKKFEAEIKKTVNISSIIESASDGAEMKIGEMKILATLTKSV